MQDIGGLEEILIKECTTVCVSQLGPPWQSATAEHHSQAGLNSRVRSSQFWGLGV